MTSCADVLAGRAPKETAVTLKGWVRTRRDSKVLLESDGLVMVETDRAKAPPVAAAAEEPQHLGRPRRERPKPPAQDDELKQVETKR